MTYDGSPGHLPTRVMKWLGAKLYNGYFHTKDGPLSLSTMNDQGDSFVDIADIIESQPEGLFHDSV